MKKIGILLYEEKGKGEKKEVSSSVNSIDSIHGIYCPICNAGNGEKNNGCLCIEHDLKIKDFNWLRNWINGLNELDSTVIYILETAIADRKAYIINDVPIEDGRLEIEEYLERKLRQRKLDINRERILKEILLLEKALVKIRSSMIEYRNEYGNRK